MAKFNAFGKEKGWIELICGPMFAGKSEELLRRLKRLEYADVSYVVFKPSIDTRTNKKIMSRDGRSSTAIEFEDPYKILEHVKSHIILPQVVAIDEAQFCSNEIIDVCEALADSGVIVYVAALDRNFKNEPFPVTAQLSCYAEHITKLSAVCTECGAPGTISLRLINGKPAHYDSPIVQIGNQESYTVRCRHHHSVPGKPMNDIRKNFKNVYEKSAKKQKHYNIG